MSGNNTNQRAIMRDANIFEVLSRPLVASMGDLAGPLGLVFPDPMNPSRPMPRDFCITQIVVVSTIDFFWQLKIGVDPLGNPKHPLARIIHGAGLAALPVSIPYTIAMPVPKDTFANFLIDTDMGAPLGPGTARIELYGYYDKLVPKVA